MLRDFVGVFHWFFCIGGAKPFRSETLMPALLVINQKYFCRNTYNLIGGNYICLCCYPCWEQLSKNKMCGYLLVSSDKVWSHPLHLSLGTTVLSIHIFIHYLLPWLNCTSRYIIFMFLTIFFCGIYYITNVQF